jgi:hypothetical protein
MTTRFSLLIQYSRVQQQQNGADSQHDVKKKIQGLKYQPDPFHKTTTIQIVSREEGNAYPLYSIV